VPATSWGRWRCGTTSRSRRTPCAACSPTLPGASGRLGVTGGYSEVVTTDGRDLVVFHELLRGGWFSQRA